MVFGWSRQRYRAAVAAGCLLWSGFSSAEDGVHDRDAEVYGASYTHAELFRRALVPGPEGALIVSERRLPVTEYFQLGASNVDSFLGADSLKFELGGWGSVETTRFDGGNTWDGDLQSAHATLSLGDGWVRLGRQQAAGGAARYSRFDGAQLGLTVIRGLSIEAYGGFTVLPRYDDQPGYYHLGAAADSLLRTPDAIEPVERSGHWLGGGRIAYSQDRVWASLSLHEQRANSELSYRLLGFDLKGDVHENVELGGRSLVELDSARVADFRLWADLHPAEPLDVSVDYLSTEPALLLSRQTVLSVFSTDAYDETGASLSYRLLPELSVGGGGWVQWYGDSEQGARGEANVRLSSRGAERTSVVISYTRVITPDNGYHALRVALGRKLLERLRGTLESYGYFYDEPIAGYRTSNVYAGTLSYSLYESLSLLWGASLARTPYAASDASTLLRLSYAFSGPVRRRSW